MRALITGAGAPGGIGLASTRALGQAGAELVITSTTGRIFARAAELTAEGHRVTAHQADLLFAKVALEGRKGRRLAASRWFPYGAHIGYIKVNQVTESVQAGHG